MLKKTIAMLLAAAVLLAPAAPVFAARRGNKGGGRERIMAPRVRAVMAPRWIPPTYVAKKTNTTPKPAPKKEEHKIASPYRHEEHKIASPGAREEHNRNLASRMHEPQATSDAQLRQAQSLLTPPLTMQKLQQARQLLSEGDHDYDGHRMAALDRVDEAIRHFSSHPNRAEKDLKEASSELTTALQTR